jgi:hypothetical protein
VNVLRNPHYYGFNAEKGYYIPTAAMGEVFICVLRVSRTKKPQVNWLVNVKMAQR